MSKSVLYILQYTVSKSVLYTLHVASKSRACFPRSDYAYCDAEAVCAARDARLCFAEELCPDGALYNTNGVRHSGHGERFQIS